MYNLNPLMRNNWRASLVPAATVIPACLILRESYAGHARIYFKNDPNLDRRLSRNQFPDYFLNLSAI